MKSVQPLQISDRSKVRMERLRQQELEQLRWEQEALTMPEDLNRALMLSFESVKTEFSDLDGLSWSRCPVPLVTNPWVHDEQTPKATCTELGEFPLASDPPSSCCAMSSHTELASSAPENAMRTSRVTNRSSRSPLQSSHNSPNPPGTATFGTTKDRLGCPQHCTASSYNSGAHTRCALFEQPVLLHNL